MIFESRKNAKNNIKFGILENCVKVLCPFLIRTLTIKILGESYIGINSLFTSFLGILSLAELGFDSAIVCIMYESVSKGDNNTTCALLRFIKTAYLVVGAIILSLGIMAMPIIEFLIKDPESIPSDINIYLVYLIFLFDTCVGYFLGAYRNSLVNAYQRRDIISNAYSISLVLITALQSALIVFFEDYTLYIITKPIATIMQNMIVIIFSKRLFPDIKPIGALSAETKNKLKKIVAGTFCCTIGGKISVGFDNIIISSMLGIIMLAQYSNYFCLIAALQSIFLMVTTSIKPIIGNKVNTETVEYNYSLLRKMTLLYTLIVSWATVTLFCLIQKFIKIWIGNNELLPMAVVICFCIYFYISIHDAVFQMFKEALGIFWEDRYRVITGGLVNLAINILMVISLRSIGEAYALAGVIASTILSMTLVLTPWAINVTFRLYFKDGKRGYYLQLIYSFLGMVVSCILTYPISLLMDDFIKNLYINFIMTGIMCMIVPTIILLMIFSRFKYFEESLQFIKVIKK